MTQKDKILYIGYGFTAQPGLQSLLDQGTFDITKVIAPPMEKGRYRKHGQVLNVEQLANHHDIPLVHTNDNEAILNLIQQDKPDSVLLCAYNKLFSDTIRQSGPSFYVLHHGLYLPRFRGSSNSEWSVRLGLNAITLSLFNMVVGLDEGDLYWEKEIKITDDETIVDMRNSMNATILQNLGKVYEKALHLERSPELSATVHKRPQREEGATYTCSIREEDSEINWKASGHEIWNLIRSVSCDDPEHGLDPAYTFYNGKQLKILEARLIPSTKVWEGHIPGKPITRSGEGVEVLTGDQQYNILLRTVEYEGKRVAAKEVITSIRDTLGMSSLDFLSKIQSLEEKIRSLESK